MDMRQIYLRIITQTFDPDVEAQIKQSVRKILSDVGIDNIDFSSFSPYWKNLKQGELTAQCATALPLNKLQQLFADIWLADTADIHHSAIYLPNVSFLWVSE